MPQLVLQYTANIQQDVDFKDMFARFHHVLAHTGGIKIGNCKSRAIKLEDYYIAQGGPDEAFVHLDARFMEGRSAELKQKIGQQLLDIMKEVYSPSIKEYNLQITVEINDIACDSYFKFPEGTLTKI
ncbi:MAG: 5-carboxymethyl-2-hydroxymuconate Delta-isomerase [bacterium]|nr:5-carboxymethyl-2-hydroxymuconate Delta-isomerase [bacterium]